MFSGIDVLEIVACAPRPEGSWGHALVLVAFVLAARALAPRRRAPRAGTS